MGFKKTDKVASGDPILVELDAGIATLSNGETIKFPDGLEYVNENEGEKLGIRVIQQKPGAPSFILIKGATRATVLNAVRRCELGV